MDETTDTPTQTDNELTPEEIAFAIKVLSEGINLQGNYASLVPTMNMIESIIRKLSHSVA